MAQGELNEGVNLVLVGNAAATLMMTGCIWLIQVLVYPIMSRVGAAQFPAYEAAHISGVTLVVGPLMLAEAITSLLLIGARPASVPVWMPLAGMACVAVVWIVTGCINVPQHNALALGFDGATHSALVASNWIRTLAWSAHAALVCAMVWLAMR
jgi:hypothetical protein